jgi:hypothetical protein
LRCIFGVEKDSGFRPAVGFDGLVDGEPEETLLIRSEQALQLMMLYDKQKSARLALIQNDVTILIMNWQLATFA